MLWCLITRAKNSSILRRSTRLKQHLRYICCPVCHRSSHCKGPKLLPSDLSSQDAHFRDIQALKEQLADKHRSELEALRAELVRSGHPQCTLMPALSRACACAWFLLNSTQEREEPSRVQLLKDAHSKRVAELEEQYTGDLARANQEIDGLRQRVRQGESDIVALKTQLLVRGPCVLLSAPLSVYCIAVAAPWLPQDEQQQHQQQLHEAETKLKVWLMFQYARAAAHVTRPYSSIGCSALRCLLGVPHRKHTSESSKM